MCFVWCVIWDATHLTANFLWFAFSLEVEATKCLGSKQAEAFIFATAKTKQIQEVTAMTIPPQHHHYYDWFLLCPSRYVDPGGLERAKVWPKLSWIMPIVLCLPLQYTFCPHNHSEGTLRYIYIYIYIYMYMQVCHSLWTQLTRY